MKFSLFHLPTFCPPFHGDPDQCAERIAQIRATGVTNVGLIANFGGLEHTKVLASLDRFAKYVMPRVKRNA